MFGQFTTRTGFVATASVWLGCTLGAGALGAAALLLPRAPAAPALPEAGTSTEGVVAAGDPNVCVTAFSKDLCGGSLNPGGVLFGSCVTPDGEQCKTVGVTGAEWKFSLAHNNQACSTVGDPFFGRCDEAIEKDGTLTAKIDYTMRLHRPCPYRACFSGTWEFQAVDGTIYRGTVMGTMGVGSHRPSACLIGGRDCERCLDVEFRNDLTWRIGVEATFQGQRVNSKVIERDEICFSLSGDFIAPTMDDGITLDPFSPWRFGGTADGAHIHCN